MHLSHIALTTALSFGLGAYTTVSTPAAEPSVSQIKALGLTTTEPKIAGGVDFNFVEQPFVDFDGHLIVLYKVLGSAQ